MEISYDKWEGVMDKGKSFTSSHFSEVKPLIERLDQHTYTLVCFGGENSHLLIGGGCGKYIVCLTIGADEEIYTLVNDQIPETDEEIDVVTGGQLGSFTPKIVVDFKTAVQACRHYFEQQSKDSSLCWKQE